MLRPASEFNPGDVDNCARSAAFNGVAVFGAISVELAMAAVSRARGSLAADDPSSSMEHKGFGPVQCEIGDQTIKVQTANRADR